jgi:hypothetical protein
MSMVHWRSLKGKGQPTVWRDIASIAWMGRAPNVHLIVVAQRLDNKATGGIGLRDSLGFRGLAGYRQNQWRMLMATRPVPRSQKPKGRWIFSDGETETWVQCLYAKPDEIRDYASAGRQIPVVVIPPPVEVSGLLAEPVDASEAELLSEDWETLGDDDSELV